MNFTQKIKLKSVTANNEAVMFKVEVDGENRIFFGKQSSKFALENDNTLEHYSLSEKLSCKMKLNESFQKAYLVDKPVMGQEDVKKDVIIPAAVSKEIVQLGNYLYSLSKETNNEILYLLYKKKLINRYVDDKSHIVFYDLDLEKLPKDTSGDLVKLLPDEILKGTKTASKSYPGLINEFNKAYKKEIEINDLENPDVVIKTIQVDTVTNLENQKNYKNMEGYLESLEDYINVNNLEDQMPFNLIYEYGEERQYENDTSQIYSDFIHMKNCFSPFFNVDVTDEKKFQVWRKYKKLESSNFKLWTSYSLVTPMLNEEKKLPNATPLNLGNNVGQSDFYSNIEAFLGDSTVNSEFSENLNSLGFTLHVDSNRDELVNRFMFSYQSRRNAEINADRNYLQKTPEQFVQWLIDNSKGLIYRKINSISAAKYPSGVKFVVDVVYDDRVAKKGSCVVLECIEDASSLVVAERLEWPYPSGVNCFNFNYDDMEFIVDGKNKTLESPFYVRGVEYYGKKYDLVNWKRVVLEDPVIYSGESFVLRSEDSSEVEYVHDPYLGSEQISVKTKDKSASELLFKIKMLQLSEVMQKVFDKDSGFCRKCKLGDIWSDGEIEELYKPDSSVTVGDILADTTSSETDVELVKTLGLTSKAKWILGLLYINHEPTQDKSGRIVPSEEGPFFDVTNYELCEANGQTTLDDLIYAFDYYRKNLGQFTKGMVIKFWNPRLAKYDLTKSDNDAVTNTTQYRLTENSGPSINYYANPFELRKALTDSDQVDPSLYSPALESSIIDLFGLSVFGIRLKDASGYESAVVTAMKGLRGNRISIDLVVSLRSERGSDEFIVNSYINGQLVNSIDYSVEVGLRSLFVNEIRSLGSLRFWCYGESDNGETYPFNYRNIAMWNYPLSLTQVQRIYRALMNNKSLDDFENKIFYLDHDNPVNVEEVVSDETNQLFYGKIFNKGALTFTGSYLYDSDEVYEHQQKLFKVQDFEYVERINSFVKFTPVSDRKSNLYSIRLHNTGLVENPEDDDKTRQFKQEVNSVLLAAINTICSKTEPINTKLFTVLIDS